MADEDFAEFMRANGGRLFRVAYLLTADHGRAEDLTQDALARAYAAWGRVRRDDAYSYVRRTIVNLHTDWWRARRWRERPTADLPDRATGEEDPGTALARRDSVTASLQTLGRRQRSMVVLRYYADLSEADIALELGVSVGTVKSTLSRALARLRDSNLAERHEELVGEQ
ncbi:SigE family RNA polymerase sigma factor [Longispora sp. K20-0274]|uniref:SigE family RNA polymerase sigma factor n=1 Tax=Longispora sp. K20-0274 TaxID=3088255 RepID=UPI00399AF825